MSKKSVTDDVIIDNIIKNDWAAGFLLFDC
jgi:hypothetical protein